MGHMMLGWSLPEIMKDNHIMMGLVQLLSTIIVMIINLTLITFGKMLEVCSQDKTTDALKWLMKLTPQTAVIIANGVEEIIPVDKVKKGDIFAVRPGESIPVD